MLKIQWNLCNPTPKFSDILWHPSKNYGPKVYLLTKINPEYWDILYNLTLFPGPLECQIRQVPLYIEITQKNYTSFFCDLKSTTETRTSSVPKTGVFCFCIYNVYIYGTLILNQFLFLCPAYNSMGQYSFSVCPFFVWLVRSSVPLYLVNAMFWDHWYVSFHICYDDWSWCVIEHIISTFWLDDFVGGMGLYCFHAFFIYIVVILGEHNLSEVVDSIAFIFSSIIGHDVMLVILYLARHTIL